MDLSQRIKQLGLYVREKRKEKGFKTLADFSKATGVGTSYLSNIETGYIQPDRGPVVPKDDVLAAIAKPLGIPVSELHSFLGRLGDDVTAITDSEITEIWRQFPADFQRDLKELAHLSEAERNLWMSKLSGYLAGLKDAQDKPD